jgi:hypothetical protein
VLGISQIFLLVQASVFVVKNPGCKIQVAKHMKLKKNEDQIVVTLPLLRIGNNNNNNKPIKGLTETKFGAETKGLTI